MNLLRPLLPSLFPSILSAECVLTQFGTDHYSTLMAVHARHAAANEADQRMSERRTYIYECVVSSARITRRVCLSLLGPPFFLYGYSTHTHTVAPHAMKEAPLTHSRKVREKGKERERGREIYVVWKCWTDGRVCQLGSVYFCSQSSALNVHTHDSPSLLVLFTTPFQSSFFASSKVRAWVIQTEAQICAVL